MNGLEVVLATVKTSKAFMPAGIRVAQRIVLHLGI